MSTRIPADPADPHLEPPADGGADGSRNGSGAQTALLAMLKKRTMRVNRDADGEPPQEGAADTQAE